MIFRNQPDGIPAGYRLLPSKVLVPSSIEVSLPMSDENESVSWSVPVSEERPEVQDAAPPPAPQKPRSRMLHVYGEAEVADLESGLQALSKSSDRRRSLEPLLQALKQQAPIGHRTYVRVPRDYQQRLDRLEAAMPNFRQVIHQIRLLLTLQKAGRNLLSVPPILLAGDPGIGKTFFAMEFAKAMRLECRTVHMESATSGMLLTGLEQFYATASPGIVFEALVKGRHANPVLVVDELDKASKDARHPPANALYQLLEQNTAKQFRDQACPDIALDASHINWIVTANDLGAIPPPLLSRMTVIHAPEPTGAERIQIARQLYRDLRCGDSWGRRFEPELSERTALMLAGFPGSIRRLQSILRLAFAYALDRKSRSIEVCDLNKVTLSQVLAADFEQTMVMGNA